MEQEWTVHEVARLAGTTSRTLRHYGAEGLLPPSRVGANGYRYYDAAALVTLQRILLLRDLGLGLPEIGRILRRDAEPVAALERHLDVLQEERRRLDRRIRAVTGTITTMREGNGPMAEEMFDGFDHAEHREEVERRWGAPAYAGGDRWWRSMSAEEREQWQRRQADLADAWTAAAASGAGPTGEEALALAERHRAWLAEVPGTPRDATGGPSDEYLLGLGEMYVDDERFAAHYGGVAGARFVRDALRALVERRG
ncbi:MULTISPECIES: TipAS antibiotic-recognition domain-containing protein [unclassified Rathayibacter]|uniref:MerR family transcriptional regulator n=1 Tax=unclassified Rathayibacter TaxID=2609250 RepID=UPI000CE902C9|nr:MULTISPECIES: TipAS antibiotic-recognition domain-containing protein [unclassified Rathayibacter]PPF26165.1 MerR family transcriptional regulator [Rathayibacter sp. AY1F2]PPG19856.1 MerR family transcriptional regulator [Rathayibacter sp. AY1E8]PPG41315.1 MerR family transcriptional regulator [Rathayibacter sp. AY2B5]PPH42057.1 MerR family transcriptional regulator [Rathayibacter sp. AY1F7]